MNPEASLRAGLHPSIVLSAYLEPLLRGRRVAILGDATIGLADELSQRGARLLHVYDPDAARVAEAKSSAITTSGPDGCEIWTWLSMPPGSASRPVASISRAAPSIPSAMPTRSKPN